VQIRVSTRHGQLNDESQAKITEKAEKLLRFFDRLTDIEVVVDLSDHRKLVVDLKVSAEHKHDFAASADGPELMTVLDAAIQKMEQQLRKYKNKLVERGRTKDRPSAPVDEETANED
jgi:putative sigma-54 modulation protein